MDVLHIARTIAICTVGISTAAAQNLTTYLPNAATSNFDEFPARSPASASSALLGPYAAPVRPFVTPDLGAVAIDNEREVTYSTNGLNTIERVVYPRKQCGVGVAMPALPIPAAVGRVTGMAVNPATSLLYLTNGRTIFEVDAPGGMAILCSWPASPLNAVSGLDFDSATPNELIAVSTAGEVARYSICGALMAVNAPTYPWPGARAVGVAVDKSAPAGGDAYVLYANGEMYNHNLAAVAHTGVRGVGLTYAASPVHLPSASSCAGVAPRAWTDALATQGKMSFGFSACNLPAGTKTVFLILNGGFGPPITGAWGTFWLPGGFVIPVAVPAAATSVNFPLPLPGGTAGLGFYAQWAVPCSGGGLAFTNALQVEISR